MELTSQLERRGYKASSAPIERLRDLYEILTKPYRKGLLDEEVYQKYIARFRFTPPADLPDARSIIVVTAPQPQFRVTFTWRGEPVQVVIPPTYLYAREADEQALSLVTEILEPLGYRAVEATLPEKLLAVCSGLAAYGKNNVSYVPGMGSFHRPTALFSDAPCPGDNWREPQMMASCEKCSACQKSCPTGAIADDRFLIRAERCLTFHNEMPNDVPFADWIVPSWHNALVGCMHCQRVCPQNKDHVGRFEDGATFSEQETALLLEGVPLDQLPLATAEKLKPFQGAGILEMLPRNLGAFLA